MLSLWCWFPGGLILIWYPSMQPAVWTKAGLCAGWQKLSAICGSSSGAASEVGVCNLAFISLLTESISVPWFWKSQIQTSKQRVKAHGPTYKVGQASLSPGPSRGPLERKVFLANVPHWSCEVKTSLLASLWTCIWTKNGGSTLPSWETKDRPYYC